MCGHVGVLSTNINYIEKEVFKELLLISQLRGSHGTGVASVSPGKTAFYKRAVNATDFTQLSGFSNVLEQSNTYSALMGHVRHATQGLKTDPNAHPFVCNNITLMHNGTVYRNSLTSTTGANYGTDSELVTAALASTIDKKSILEKMTGAYALVWFDSNTNELNFARNKERPFYFAWSKDRPTMYWGSEKGMLGCVLSRKDIDCSSVEELPVGSWIKFNLEGNFKDSREEVRFEPKELPPPTQIRYTGYGYNYGTQSSYFSGGQVTPFVDPKQGGVDNSITMLDHLKVGSKILFLVDKFKRLKKNKSLITGWVQRHTRMARAVVSNKRTARALEELAKEEDHYSAVEATITGFTKEQVVLIKISDDVSIRKQTPALVDKNCAYCYGYFYEHELAEYHESSDKYYHAECLDEEKLDDLYIKEAKEEELTIHTV